MEGINFIQYVPNRFIPASNTNFAVLSHRVQLMQLLEEKRRTPIGKKGRGHVTRHQHIHFLPQERVKSMTHLAAIQERAQASQWEGLILRKDAPYVGKRRYVI